MADAPGVTAIFSPAGERALQALERQWPKDFPEFRETLLSFGMPLDKPRYIKAYFDFWQCVPSRIALHLAIESSSTLAELAAFQRFAEGALLSAPDVAEFELWARPGDPRDEVLQWLKDRAYQHKVAAGPQACVRD